MRWMTWRAMSAGPCNAVAKTAADLDDAIAKLGGFANAATGGALRDVFIQI